MLTEIWGLVRNPKNRSVVVGLGLCVLLLGIATHLSLIPIRH